MRKQVAAALALVLLFAIPAATRQSEQKPVAGASGHSSKLVTIRGTVVADGKVLISEDRKTVWTVANAETLADNVGDHVSVRALIDVVKHEIRVVTVRFSPVPGVLVADAAFRR
ncbi:MAG TPA: hypothetical protein VEJ67_16010 [Candidatus Cybelea sp.]|nr:hypothetical protein [Candidatus Cybelea sp.]